MDRLGTNQSILCSSCGIELGFVTDDVVLEHPIYCKYCHDNDPKDELTSAWDVDIFSLPFVDFCLQGSDEGIVMAHKVVLAGKSRVFKAMLSTNMSERQHAKVEVADMTVQELKPFVNFLYTGSVSTTNLENHAIALFKASEKYEIPLLKTECESFLTSNVFRNVHGVFELAETYDSKPLQQAVLPYLFHEDFVKNNSAVEVVKAFRKASTFEGFKEYRKEQPRKIAHLMEIAVCQIADCITLENSEEAKQTNH